METDETVIWNISECKKYAKKKKRRKIQNLVGLCKEGDPLGIVQEMKIWPLYQMINAQTRIRPWEWDT